MPFTQSIAQCRQRLLGSLCDTIRGDVEGPCTTAGTRPDIRLRVMSATALSVDTANDTSRGGGIRGSTTAQPFATARISLSATLLDDHVAPR
ncbi:hypothetical protein JDV02_003737 [Purpureocillium takamizusanense]|uniref:Uncharacterized protein n=1 Tax=Purpureocillium takamizusanense TaxID=2060973 RepID=A0A9Q8QCZ8_9HYPO|nr:uncharacterized protein JDV02_003737 [Purpureocillium takamizusanense]UNI17395.1 hypothetical protein JDV02_003737 [Purpureocillium takamizusanense]